MSMRKPGTTMAAVGVSKAEDQAALIAYLQAETTAETDDGKTNQQDPASQRE